LICICFDGTKYQGQPVNVPSGAPKPQTEFGLFPCDQAVSEPAHLRERLGTKKGITPTAQGIAEWRSPLNVAQLFVDGSLGVSLATSTTNRSTFRTGLEVVAGIMHPAIDDFAVAIDEHDETNFWMKRKQSLVACVARSRSGERRA